MSLCLNVERTGKGQMVLMAMDMGRKLAPEVYAPPVVSGYG